MFKIASDLYILLHCKIYVYFLQLTRSFSEFSPLWEALELSTPAGPSLVATPALAPLLPLIRAPQAPWAPQTPQALASDSLVPREDPQHPVPEISESVHVTISEQFPA